MDNDVDACIFIQVVMAVAASLSSFEREYDLNNDVSGLDGAINTSC